jgi:predicted Zn-dependent peptidase
METIDRNIAPEIRDIKDVRIENPEVTTLSNGVEVFIFNAGTQELVRIELMLKAGAKYHHNKRLPIIVNKLITQGTQKMSGDDIAGLLDYYGASLTTKVTNDYAFISLTVLNKYISETLPVVADILTEATFPPKEYDLYLTKKSQELAINNQRTDFVARDRFPAILFGEDNAYGRPSYIEDYQEVTVDELKDFHRKYYAGNSFEIHISGMVPDDLTEQLDKFFGGLPNNAVEPVILKNFKSSGERKHRIEFPDALQNSLRIGRRWVSRSHKDYAGLQVLITLFGGYFGSRLMMNIREDKGYTYGIGAGVSQFQDASFMFITSDVKTEASGDAVKEIYLEMQKLKDEKVSAGELALVKTVMQGAFQRGFDGPFARADRYKEMRMAGLDFDFYRRYLSELKVVTPDKLQRLAEEYLDFDNIYELIVGKFTK